MSIRATSPYTIYLDADGMPLTGGYVYFGTAGSNPETTPQATFWDEALAIPAAQPLRTINGFIVRNGSPGTIYTAAAYSVTVKNKNGALVFSALTNPGSPIGSVMVPVYTAATLAAGLTALGFSTFFQTLISSADPIDLLSALMSIRAVASTDYVILDADGYTYIDVTTGAADRTITLPARASNVGRKLLIRKADSGVGKVIVTRAGADTIDGATTINLHNQYTMVTLLASSTEWAVVRPVVDRVESRTDDPAAPIVGQVWFRSDL